MNYPSEIKNCSSSDIVAGIRQVLQELQPFIQSHNGSIEFVAYTDFQVYVKLHGACSTCPISSYTLQLGILQRLQQKYPEITHIHDAE